MARRLPPLNAMRAFEAAARHLSFTHAARELHVTPAAVSHQIKALEDWLGLPLFRRRNREVVLTEAGETFYPGLRDGFDRLAGATERVTARDETGELRVSTSPSFAAKWLVPRLYRLRAAHPEIDVLLSTSDHLVDFGIEKMDVGLRYGTGRYPGLEVIRLMETDVFPVCAPALADGDPPLRLPADLSRHTLLHDDFDVIRTENTVTWEMWLRAAGVEGAEAGRGPGFTDSSMVLMAAIDGQGVALARGTLAAGDLAAGRLVKPFDLALPSNWAYYVVYPPEYRDRPKIKAFRAWLLAEAEIDRDVLDGARPATGASPPLH